MPAPVIHLVDAMGSTRLWGKERAIQLLMLAQRRAGLNPSLVTFAPSSLVDVVRAAGFPATVLGSRSERFAVGAVRQLVAHLRAHPGAVLHTHGYKANVVGRLARAAGAPMSRLIATVHGMNDETWKLAQYNRLDRISSVFSDAVAIADATLTSAFPRRARVLYVANGIDTRPPFDESERAVARQRFALPPNAIVIGLLGRINEAKGVRDALAAMRTLGRDDLVLLFTGEGELVDEVRATPGARWVGYVDSDSYLPALDVYLQASHMEGLSLALLEAMRGGLPSIVTRVGSTDLAVDDDVEALLVEPKAPDAMAAAIARLADDTELRARLGAGARRRFETQFSIDRQAAIYSSLYSATPLSA